MVHHKPNKPKKRDGKYKFLIGCADFSRRTGMPHFLLTLSRELIRRGHQIAIVAPMIGLAPEAEIPQFNLSTFTPEVIAPDAIILNEPFSEMLLNLYPDTPAFNIIHSPREADAPIVGHDQIRRYLAVKPEDRNFLASKGIKPEKIRMIDIPIDFKHFNAEDHLGQVVVPDGSIKWDIASLSTIDSWRQPMLMALIKQAKAGKRVLIAGENIGGIGKFEQFEGIKTLTIIPEVIEDVRPYIAQSKCIAGLFVGTITVEAWAMGKATEIYNLSGKVIDRFPIPPADAHKHDVRNVADRFLDIVTEYEADIIIPHHNRKDLLGKLLCSLPTIGFNIIIANYGGCFSENNNEGARRAKTDNFIFCNDDIVMNNHSLWGMMDDPADAVGCRTVYPDGRPQYLGLGLRFNPIAKKVEYYLAQDRETTHFPSGGCFRIRKNWFWDCGRPEYSGFDETYINGGEDQDLFLCGMAKGMTISFCEIPVTHVMSASEGRFTYVEENEALYRKRWLDNIKRLNKIFDFPEGDDTCEG